MCTCLDEDLYNHPCAASSLQWLKLIRELETKIIVVECCVKQRRNSSQLEQVGSEEYRCKRNEGFVGGFSSGYTLVMCDSKN